MFLLSKPGGTPSSGSSRISCLAADACPGINPVLLPDFVALKQAYRGERKKEK